MISSKRRSNETVNKEYPGIPNTVGNYWRRSFSIIRSFSVTIRALQFGCDRRDLFFIKYFRLQERHYKNHVIPIFWVWRGINTTLQYHATIRECQFDNLLIDSVERIEHSDSQSIARCHLKSYRYTDGRSFENISKIILKFNNRVRTLRDHLYEAVHIYISTQILSMKPYDQNNWSDTNYYHYSNILYYFWSKSWEIRENKSEAYLVLTREGNEFHIRIKPGGEPIAKTAKREDAEKLYNYLLNQSDGITNWLNILVTDRNEVINHYNTFIHNINLILSEYRWTDSIKGKCIWEKRFWRIRNSDENA